MLRPSGMLKGFGMLRGLEPGLGIFSVLPDAALVRCCAGQIGI